MAAVVLGERAGPAITRGVLPALLVLAGLVVGLLPALWGAALVAATIVVALGVARPRLPLYMLGLAAPLASAAEARVGGIGVSPTDLLVGLALVSYALARLARVDREGRVSPWMAPVALFVGAALFSSTWAASLPAAAKELLRWVELLAAFGLVVALVRTPTHARRLLTVLLLGGLVEGLIGFVQFFLQIGPPSFQMGRFLRAYGTFGQPNPYGGYLGMVLPVALAIAATFLVGWLRTAPWKDRLQLSTTSVRPLAWPLFAGLVLLVVAAAMGMSSSRGAWLGLAAGLAAVMMAAGRRTLAAVLIAGFVATLVALLGAFDVLPASVVARMGQVTQYFGVFDVRTVVVSSENWSVVERMAHWQTAIDMWRDWPWFGIGTGQYAVLYADYHPPGWPDPLGHAHNIYLNVAAEMGSVGLGLYLVMVASWVTMALLTVRRAGAPLARAVGLGVLGVVVAGATHNLFDNLYVAGMNVHLGLLLGLCAAVGSPHPGALPEGERTGEGARLGGGDSDAA